MPQVFKEDYLFYYSKNNFEIQNSGIIFAEKFEK